MPELEIILGILTDRTAVIAFSGNHGTHPFTLHVHLSIVDGLSQVAMAGMLNKGFSTQVVTLNSELKSLWRHHACKVLCRYAFDYFA